MDRLAALPQTRTVLLGALAAGMDDFLAKPIAAAALWAVLERVIQPAPSTGQIHAGRAGHAPG